MNFAQKRKPNLRPVLKPEFKEEVIAIEEEDDLNNGDCEDGDRDSYRHICFTFNNYDEAIKVFLDKWEVKYIVFGEEIAPSTGTPHLQAYVEFKCSKMGKYLRKVLRKNHFEVRKGSPKQASDYCKKGEQTHEEWKKLGCEGPNFGLNAVFYERGKISAQGQRNDLLEIKQLLDANGGNIREVADKHFHMYCRFGTAFKNYINLGVNPRTGCAYTCYFYGESGSGKTELAKRGGDPNGPIKSFYMKDNTKWWDKYRGEDVIIIDDFDGTWPFKNFLRLLDKNPYMGETKFGYIEINSPYIIVTCDKPPDFFWDKPEDANHLEQIKSRFDEIRHVRSKVGNFRTAGKKQIFTTIEMDFNENMR